MNTVGRPMHGYISFKPFVTAHYSITIVLAWFSLYIMVLQLEKRFDFNARMLNAPVYFIELFYNCITILLCSAILLCQVNECVFLDDTGQNCIVPVTGFFCQLCNKFYSNEQIAKETHCKSEGHFNLYKVKMPSCF